MKVRKSKCKNLDDDYVPFWVTHRASKFELENLGIKTIDDFKARMTDASKFELENVGIKTIGDFITYHFNLFSNMDTMTQIGWLFDSPSGPGIINCIFNGSLKLEQPSDKRFLYRKGSWVHHQYGSYIHGIMEPGSGQMLTLEKLTSHSLNVESSKKTPDKSRCETLEKILKLLKGGGSQLRCLMHTPPS